MDFNWNEFWPYVVIGVVIALFLVKRRRQQEAKMEPSEMVPMITDTVTCTKSDWLNVISTELVSEAYSVAYRNDEKQKLVIDDEKIGMFHWGFFFIMEPSKETADELIIGIYPKGVNPPKGKRLKAYLDSFMIIVKPYLS